MALRAHRSLAVTLPPETCHLLVADTALSKTQTLALVVEQAQVLNLLSMEPRQLTSTVVEVVDIGLMFKRLHPLTTAKVVAVS